MNRIAEVIDSLENTVAALELNIPAEIHVECLRQTLPEILEKLKKEYFDLGGGNVWEDPDE